MPAPTPVPRSCPHGRLLLGCLTALAAAAAWWSSAPAPEPASSRPSAPLRPNTPAPQPSPSFTVADAARLAIARASADLPAAASWADSLPASDPAVRTAALHAVAGEALRTDALLALRLLAPEPATPARDALLRRAAMELAVDAPDALAAWAETFPPGPLRDELLAGVALAASERSPDLAAALATADLTEGRLRDDTLVGIAQRWVPKQPALAAAWVASWPAGEARHAAIESVALAWADRDSDAAERWIAALR